MRTDIEFSCEISEFTRSIGLAPPGEAAKRQSRPENFPSWMGIEKLATHQCLPAAWILSASISSSEVGF